MHVMTFIFVSKVELEPYLQIEKVKKMCKFFSVEGLGHNICSEGALSKSTDVVGLDSCLAPQSTSPQKGFLKKNVPPGRGFGIWLW